MTPFYLVDVFTDRPLAGNALAVVLDGEGISDERMQAIAREFNLSEAVFVREPENARHSARIRIFTPGKELPFAGHPTVGTAVLLALEKADGDPGPHEMMMVLEENVGPVRCGAFVKGNDKGRAIFDLPKEAVEGGQTADAGTIANALSLLPGEIGFENHLPSVFSAGVPYVFVPVRDLDVIARAKANLAVWDEAFSGDANAAMVYCRETTQTGRHFHTRMFAPTFGIPEDPATGSAIAALSGVVMKFDVLPAGSYRFTIEQGFEMGRPSLISLEIDVDGGRIDAARIGGDAVVVARGSLDID